MPMPTTLSLLLSTMGELVMVRGLWLVTFVMVNGSVGTLTYAVEFGIVSGIRSPACR